MKYLMAGLTALMLAACTPTAPRNTGVYLLLDTSGTYSEELKKAQSIILFTLARLQPTDSFAVARIDTGSFSEKDIVAKATFDDRPSTMNNQKRAFAAQIKSFVELSKPATHSSTGAPRLTNMPDPAFRKPVARRRRYQSADRRCTLRSVRLRSQW